MYSVEKVLDFTKGAAENTWSRLSSAHPETFYRILTFSVFLTGASSIGIQKLEINSLREALINQQQEINTLRLHQAEGNRSLALSMLAASQETDSRINEINREIGLTKFAHNDIRNLIDREIIDQKSILCLMSFNLLAQIQQRNLPVDEGSMESCFETQIRFLKMAKDSDIIPKYKDKGISTQKALPL